MMNQTNQPKPITAVNWNSAPAFVVGFPDLDESEINAILGKGPVITDDEQVEYNNGWDAWEQGYISDNLEGLVLMGWMDAEDAYAEERRAERQLFAQTVNGPAWRA